MNDNNEFTGTTWKADAGNYITDELRDLRRARGWSLKYMEANVKGARKAVRYRSWETGDRRVTLVEAIEWAKLLGKRLALVDDEDSAVVARTPQQIADDLRALADSVLANANGRTLGQASGPDDSVEIADAIQGA